jgi:hypothetical protein
MDAAPRLVEIADAFAAAKLEAILIGNAGAALQGAPVTTLDFDYLYRVSPVNQAKLRIVAEKLGGTLTQPFPVLSTVFRIRRMDPMLQVDLTGSIHGVTSFNSLPSRAIPAGIDGRIIWWRRWLISLKLRRRLILRKIRQSCMSSKRPLKKSAKSPRKRTKREIELDLMRDYSEEALTDMIRANLSLPMHKRTHFLRMCLPDGGSCL